MTRVLFWFNVCLAAACAVLAVLCLLDGIVTSAVSFAGIGVLSVCGTVLYRMASPDDDGELTALRSIVENYQDGYEPDLERGGWVKTLHYYDSPPEWEGHPFTPRERELLTERAKREVQP